jgi:hypothetical protein
MGRIFFLGEDAAEHAKPELRRADESISDDQIYDYHQDGVTAPKGISTPPPDFSEEARKPKFQGEVTLSLVVDKAGNVARIRVDKVLVMALMNKRCKQSKPGALFPEPEVASL